MANVSREELLGRDRRRAAIHESGHVVIATAKGYPMGAHLYEREANTDPEKDTLAGGRAHFSGLATAPPAVVSVIGWGGIAAECLDDDPDVTDHDIADGVEAMVVEPSATDWAAIGETVEHFHIGPIGEALAILRTHRTLFDWCVAELLEHNVLTDGEVAKAVTRFH